MDMSRSSDRFALDQQVGSYRLIKHLGKGGFADVYLGEHIYLQNQNAIKILRVQLSEDSLQDFLNEAKTIAHLDHPNIVRVLDYGVHEETPFLVMGYAPNGSLRTRYPRRTHLPLSELIPIIQQMASALDYAHRLKLIHRDVKPENMLIGPQQQILLSDFGLALAATSSTSQASANTAGTVPYMAPEQLQGRVRYSSDQYSLAVTVYEWLCGERPFNGSFTEVASQHVLVAPSSLCERVPNLPPAVEQVVFKALAKDPTQRFETVQAFAHALQLAAQLPDQLYNPYSSYLAPSATFIQLAPPISHLENNDEFHTIPMNNNFTSASPTLNYPPSPTSSLPPTSTPPSPFTSFPTQQMAANAFSDEQLYTPYTLSQPLSAQHERPANPYYPSDHYVTPSHNTPTKQRAFPLWQVLTMVTILLLLLTVGLTLVNIVHRQSPPPQSTVQPLQPSGPANIPGNSFPTALSQASNSFPTPLPKASDAFLTPLPQDNNGITKPISNCLNTVPSHLEFTSSLSLNTIPSHIVSLRCPNDTTPIKITIQMVEGKNWLIARNILTSTSNDSTSSNTIHIFAIKDNLKPGTYHGALMITQGDQTTVIKVTFTLLGQ